MISRSSVLLFFAKPQAAGAGGGGFVVRADADGNPTTFDGLDRVDVILRPDAEAAERTVGITAFWDGVVELKGMPLIRQK